ncbi:hypothetical protein MD484_g8173, partial [Candolleomyces efflorescens]
MESELAKAQPIWGARILVNAETEYSANLENGSEDSPYLVGGNYRQVVRDPSSR